jgi:type II secretory pathway pseudopilin PulG
LKIFPNRKPEVYPAVSIVEILVAIAFMAILVTAGFQVFLLSLGAVNRSRQATIATLMTQDLIELAISKRNEGWDSLVPGEYHFVEDPDPAIGYVYTSGEETIEEFTRSITVSTVQRDSNQNIVTVGGSVDPNTFLLHAITSWTTDRGINEQVDLYTYVTNWDGF